jgi:nucleotide-binding universal stress UspA family protein
MKTIVVGFDGSTEARSALERALELAQAFHSQLVVVTVTTLVPVPIAPGLGLPGIVFEDELTEAAELGKSALDHARAVVGNRAPADFVSVEGRPEHELIKIADDRAADLIVVGTHEPGLIERVLAGSVSQGVVRRAHCDVLVVHPRRRA